MTSVKAVCPVYMCASGVASDLGARGAWLFGGPLDFDIRDRDTGKHLINILFGGPPKVGARGDL